MGRLHPSSFSKDIDLIVQCSCSASPSIMLSSYSDPQTEVTAAVVMVVVESALYSFSAVDVT